MNSHLQAGPTSERSRTLGSLRTTPTQLGLVAVRWTMDDGRILMELSVGASVVGRGCRCCGWVMTAASAYSYPTQNVGLEIVDDDNHVPSLSMWRRPATPRTSKSCGVDGGLPRLR